MTVLVTGGAGFIGSNIVDELMVQGHEVRVLDDLSEGKVENLDRWRGHPRFQLIQGSILDYDLVKRACDHVSYVMHLAADSRIQTGISDPRHSVETNVVGTTNVAEAARQNGVRRLVYAASSSAYGRRNDWIFEEEDFERDPGRGFHEELPTDCLNPYSMSKKAGEDILDVYHRLYGLSTCSLRLFNVYGPRHQEDGRYATVIAIFRKQLRHSRPMTIVGDGHQRRDFTFVGDIVNAFMLAMMNWDATGVFNIGTGTNYSINELSGIVFDQYNANWTTGALNMEGHFQHIEPRLGEAKITLADNTKARDILGWEPKVSLRDGLAVLDAYERMYPPSRISVAR